MKRHAILLTAALAALAARQLAAQTNPAIRTAVQLAAEGRSDSAYRLVSAELARARTGDSNYVEALYWRARLATYGDSAERDLRRVAIEYASSPWADDALLQLSQLQLAGGSPAAAFDLAGKVRSDYPGSDLKPRAALWAARAAFEIGEPRIACALLDSARAEAAADVEFLNQVMFYRGRCSAALLAPPRQATRDSMPAAPAPPPVPRESTVAPPPAPPPGTPLRNFEVQVAAANSDQAARDVVDRLTRAGLRARVVPGEGTLRRVRMGPFSTQAAADQAARAAQRVVGGNPFVVRVP